MLGVERFRYTYKRIGAQSCPLRRQTYKIALVYVGPGQEEKQDILSNPRGSIEFQRFASNLGWSVNLASHQGFTGGLQYPEDGDVATYFASPAVEVIFHVSTQMPSATDEDRHRMVSPGTSPHSRYSIVLIASCFCGAVSNG